MLFKFISYFFMLFWYKLGIHRNVLYDTPLPNCSIDNKWPFYIPTTLWICGPNNVTENVPQNSLDTKIELLNGKASHQY